MADDVLRMRATVVSDQALRDLRAIQRELGAVPNAGRGVAQLNTQFQALGKTVQNLSGALRTLGVGVSAVAIVRSMNELATKMTELKYSSKELGMSETALRSWTSAAEKVGIAPEAMTNSLKAFKRNTEDFSLRIGDVRNRLVALGAGPVLARINAAATQTEKLKAAFDFKKVLDAADPSGVKGRRFFEEIQLGADAARLSYEQFMEEFTKKKALSPADIKAAEDYRKAWIDLGDSWDALKIKFGVKLFPFLQEEIDGWRQILDYMNQAKNTESITLDELNARRAKAGQPALDPKQVEEFKAREVERQRSRGEIPEGKTGIGELWRRWFPPAAAPPAGGGAQELTPQQFKNFNRSKSGFKPISFDGLDGTPAQGAMEEFQRAIRGGVYDALVDFSGGGGGGFQNASYSPGGGVDNTPIGRAFRAARPGGGGAPSAPGMPSTPPSVPGGPQAPGAPAAPPGGPTSAPAAPSDGAPIPPGGGSAGAALDKALTMEGKHERINNADISQYLRTGGAGMDPAKVPWCAAFVNSSLKQAGLKGSGSQAATSFLNWGQPVKGDPQKGDVLVQARGRKAGQKGGHVGFATGRTRIRNGVPEYEMFSGNTGDRASRDWRPASALTVRRATPAEGATGAPNGQPGASLPPNGQPDASPTPNGQDTKATWFHTGAPFQAGPGQPVWSDPAGRAEGAPASGLPSTTPGIATPGRGGLNEWYQVTLPDGRTAVVQKTDIGPGGGARSKGIGLDINAPFAAEAYPGGPSTFPSGKGGFSFKRIGPKLPPGMTPGMQPVQKGSAAVQSNVQPGERRLMDDAISPPRVNGHVNVTVNSNGTKAKTDVENKGDLFQNSTIKQHRQMQPTNNPSVDV